MTWKEQQERKYARMNETQRINDMHRRLHDAFWGRNGYELQKIEEKDDGHDSERSH